MSISIAHHVDIAIQRALTALCEWEGVTNTSDVDLHDIEVTVASVLLELEWVEEEDIDEAAEGLAPAYDGFKVSA